MGLFAKNTIFTAVACLFRNEKGKKRQWFIVKPKKDDPWELPRITVRKGESSARAAVRMVGEQLGISGRILSEAGRAGGTTSVNGKTIPQRVFYYLMKQKAVAGEVLVFDEFLWADYASCVRKLSTKRDRAMLKGAREELEKWLKEKAKKKVI